MYPTDIRNFIMMMLIFIPLQNITTIIIRIIMIGGMTTMIDQITMSIKNITPKNRPKCGVKRGVDQDIESRRGLNSLFK